MSDKPIFYYQPLPTGDYFGPLHHESRDLDNVRRMAWTPLYERPVQLMSQAAADVLTERRRQIDVEGWTLGHDDQNRIGAMARAAACYAECAFAIDNSYVPMKWPFHLSWWKPTTPRRDLVKAAALILAEIERLDRATNRGSQP